MKRLSLILALAAITTTVVAADCYPQEPKDSKAKKVTAKKMVKKVVKKQPLKVITLSK